jgi:hypothetical protein
MSQLATLNNLQAQLLEMKAKGAQAYKVAGAKMEILLLRQAWMQEAQMQLIRQATRHAATVARHTVKQSKRTQPNHYPCTIAEYAALMGR